MALDPALGPLAFLVGTWEGDKGHDTAPSSSRSTEVNLFRERMVFEPTGAVDNHEQHLFGLRYRTTAWRIGQPDPFHEELGYWLWDAAANHIMRCFMVPRGVTMIAGGSPRADGSGFDLAAESGSTTHGILSGPFLDREFRTIRYTLKVDHLGPDSFRYEEDTVLQIRGQREPFHHIDKNTLRRTA